MNARKSMLAALRWTMASLAVLLAALGTARADEESDKELKRIEGRYERTVTNGAGTEFRVIKDVAGDRSSVATFDDEGNIVEAHESTFRLEKKGPVWVFSYFNRTVTAGPGKGHIDPATRSYIYRVHDDTFTEVWGLLEGDDSPPRMFRWKRTAAAK
jgi:hypothetical protein